MKNLSHVIDIAFCCIFLPVMIAIYPVERWAHNFPVYTVCAGVWLYAAYAVNRLAVVPLLFGARRRKVAAAIALLALSFAVTAVLASYRLYEPKPSPYDAGIVRRLPVVEQYQQCLWSLFVIVEFFSLAFGVLENIYRRRAEWLFQAAQESAAAKMPETAAEEASPKVISIKSSRSNVVVSVADILYLEAMDNYVKVYRRSAPMLLCHTTMKAMEALLPAESFVRVHRSYIVAVEAVERYSGREVEVDSRVIPVGRTYSSRLARRL